MILSQVTLRDIARRLDISITTVSKALKNHPDISEERKKQVLDAAKEMQYVPNAMAKTLRSGKSRFVGLIVSDSSNPYYGRVISGVEETLSEKNYNLLIFNNNEDIQKEEKFLHDLMSVNVAGVILTPALGNAQSPAFLREAGIRYVLAHRYVYPHEDNYVVADDVMAGYIATKHLLGRRQGPIIFINGNNNVSAARDRYQGYLKALTESGVPIEAGNGYYSGIRQEDGYAIGNQIAVRLAPPYSILCFSDYVATGAMKALRDRGITVPNQVAVMGIDDIEMFSYMTPGLTTVHIPKKEIGRTSAKLLMNMIENPEDAKEKRIVIPPRLVIRDSA